MSPALTPSENAGRSKGGVRETIKYAFILGLICFLSSSVLAVVNGITEPKIKLQKEQEEDSALREVLTESSAFRPRYQEDKIVYYTAYDSSNRLNGFGLICRVKGYSSNIEILAGLDLYLEITAVKIVSQAETPSLGTRILEASFLGQFSGRNLDNLNQVQAITGATISSGAVIKSLKAKLSELKDQLLKEEQNAG